MKGVCSNSRKARRVLLRATVLRTTLAAVATLLLVSTPAQGASDATSVDELGEAYETLGASYAHDLEHLAVQAEAESKPELAEAIRRWRPEPPASGALLFVVEDCYAPSRVPSPNSGPLHDAFQSRRQRYAKELFNLAARAAKMGEPSLAFQWATEVVREDPNHAAARRVLGYVLVEDEWRTAFAQEMAGAGNVWHPQFGWIAADDVARYEAGKRRAGSHWIEADMDARRHDDIQDGWQIRTDHFLITTNHSIEAGAELATRLERLYQLWRQLFAGFSFSDRQVRQLFAGRRDARRRSKPFHVVYYRNKQEYVDSLRRRQPQIAGTLGIYFDTLREAHFFAGEEPGIPTLHHEAVHQLFQESHRAARNIGRVANFWAIEGVATYFESLTELEDPLAGRYYTIGQSSAGRLPAARHRALVDGYFVPLAEFTRLGQLELQRHPEIARLYSQAAGLATFLMHADGGRFRQPWVRYLRAVYAGRDGPDTLADFTDQDYSRLDALYREYLQSLP